MRKFIAIPLSILTFFVVCAATLFVTGSIVVQSSDGEVRFFAVWATALVIAIFTTMLVYRIVRHTVTANVPQTGNSTVGVFTPGAGVMPPHFAGREREELLLSRYLSVLEHGKAPPSDVTIVGPRGNGKTVLLVRFTNACNQAGVATVNVDPSGVSTQQELCGALLPIGRLGRLLPWLIAAIAAVFRATFKVPHIKEQAFIDRLAARCRRKPMVVLVDEAHTLCYEVGQYLLNVSQRTRAKAPFLLVLAGTPGLPAHLRAMDATFSDRNRRLGIGLLSEAEAKKALQKPLSDSNSDPDRRISISTQALDSVVKHSQRFPYFIQIWGEELWEKCLVTKVTRLTTEDVADVQDNVEGRMTEYYDGHYRELESTKLLSAARAVASEFQGDLDVTATDQAIDRALATLGTNEAKRLETREKLSDLGYIWCPPGQKPPVVWSPGIPSLMQHVLKRAPSA